MLKCIQRDQQERKKLYVTATTSIAAHIVGGITIHNYAGIGQDIDHLSFDDLASRIKKNAAAVERWMNTNILVIDEVSMMDCKLFETLEGLAREIRCNSSPFGGIQLVLSGDFFQLPPVSKTNTASFCFESTQWNSCVTSCIALKNIYRQKDPEFVQMLNRLRVGDSTPEILKAFNERHNATSKRMSTIEMFTHNRDVVKVGKENSITIESDDTLD